LLLNDIVLKRAIFEQLLKTYDEFPMLWVMGGTICNEVKFGVGYDYQ
jgi:hypothetical protein